MGVKIRVRFGNRKRFQFGAAKLIGGRKVRGLSGRRRSFKGRANAVGALDEGFGVEGRGLAIEVERELQGGGEHGGRGVGGGPLHVRGVVAHGDQGEGEGAAKKPIRDRRIGERAGTGGGNAAQFALVVAQVMDLVGDVLDIECVRVGGGGTGRRGTKKARRTTGSPGAVEVVRVRGTLS